MIAAMLEKGLLSYVSLPRRHGDVRPENIGQHQAGTWTVAIDFLRDRYPSQSTLHVVVPPNEGVTVDEVPIPPKTDTRTLRNMMQARSRILLGDDADYQFLHHDGLHYIAGITNALKNEITTAAKRRRFKLARITHAGYAWQRFMPKDIQILIDLSETSSKQSVQYARLLLFAEPRAEYGQFVYDSTTIDTLEDKIVSAISANLFKTQPTTIHVLSTSDTPMPHFRVLNTTAIRNPGELPDDLTFAAPLLGALGVSA